VRGNRPSRKGRKPRRSSQSARKIESKTGHLRKPRNQGGVLPGEANYRGGGDSKSIEPEGGTSHKTVNKKKGLWRGVQERQN